MVVACHILSITSRRRRLCLLDTLRKQLKLWEERRMTNLFLEVVCPDAMVLSVLTTRCNHSLEAHLSNQSDIATRGRALLWEPVITKFI